MSLFLATVVCLLVPLSSAHPSAPRARRLCADDDARLRALVLANPQSKPIASLITSCESVPNIMGKNGCTMKETAALSAEACPVTCGACVPEVVEDLPPLTCNRTLGDEDDGEKSGESSSLPPCYQSSVTDPSDLSSCTCKDKPDYKDLYSGQNCEAVYAFYLVIFAPKCEYDEGGYMSPSLLADIRRNCPLSCGVCQQPLPTQRIGKIRGDREAACDFPLDVVTASPTQYVWDLVGGSTCTRCNETVVLESASLHVRGVARGPGGDAVASISGGDVTRHFLVRGELVLENIRLMYGFSPEDGGAILVESLSGAAASARLVFTSVRDCQAFKSGGGISVRGKGSELYLEDGVDFENNQAVKGRGGAVFVANGAKMTSGSPTGAQVATWTVHAKFNKAFRSGGVFAASGVGTDMSFSGSSVRILLENGDAANGGGIACLDGALCRIVSGARVETKTCTAKGLGAGVVVLQKGSLGTKFVLSGAGTILKFTDNMNERGLTAGLMAKGGSVVISDGASYLMSGRNKRNAYSANGLGVTSSADLTVTGRNTRVILENSTGRTGPGLLVDDSKVIIADGAEFISRNNQGLYEGGGCGIALQKRSSLTVTGIGTHVVIAEGHATSRGGGGGLMVVSDSVATFDHGALVNITKNKACAGGGVFLQGGGKLYIDGAGTKVLLLGNTATGEACGGSSSSGIAKLVKAETLGGGAFAAQGEGSELFITDGAQVIAQGNSASGGTHGGGLAFHQGTSLSVTGSRTFLHVLDNRADLDGGGIALFSRATIKIVSASLGANKNIFRGNTAQRSGGAIAFATDDRSIDDGGSSCVRIRLQVEADVENAYYPRPNIGGWPRIGVRTQPKSNLDSTSWEELVNSTVRFDEEKGHRVWFSGKKTTSWCVPCGEFRFQVLIHDEELNDVHHGENPVVRVQLAQTGESVLFDYPNTLESIDRVGYHIKREYNKGKYNMAMIRLSCADQGVAVRNTIFEQNRAASGGGGALSMDPMRKNSFFEISASTFLNNKVEPFSSSAGPSIENAGKGGAAFVSGISSGLRLSKGCVIEGNVARTGGAFAVENQAGLRISDATATRNTASGPDSIGGFLFGMLSAPILLQRISIEESLAVAGGGAIAIRKSIIALEQIKISRCKSEGLGGGAIFVDEGSSAHLVGCQIEDNQVAGDESRGGHIRVAASSLVVHSLSASPRVKVKIIYFPEAPPLFQKEPLYLSPELASVLMRGRASDGAGAVFCAASTSSSPFKIIESGTQSSCQTQMFEMSCISTEWESKFERGKIWPGAPSGTYSTEAEARSACDSVEECQGISCQWDYGKECPSPAVLYWWDPRCCTFCDHGRISVCYTFSGESYSKGPITSDDFIGILKKAPCGSNSTSSSWACFDKGLHLGRGTVVRASSSDRGGGGAIIASLCDVELVGVVFEDNSAMKGDGGAILLETGSSLSADASSILRGNAASNGAGGAVACDNCRKVSMPLAMLRNNKAGLALPACPKTMSSFYINNSPLRSLPCACPGGAFSQAGEGSKQSMTCVKCQVRSMSPAGSVSKDACTCTIGTFSAGAECIKCPEENMVGGDIAKGQSACLCAAGKHGLAGWYAATNASGRGANLSVTTSSLSATCRRCPPGADCSKKDGALLSELRPKPGHWRSTPELDVFASCDEAFGGIPGGSDLARQRCCPEGLCENITAEALATNPDLQCAEGFAGPLCGRCRDGFVRQGLYCEKCDGGASLGAAFGVLIAMCTVGLIGTIVFLVLGSKAESSASKASKFFNQLKLLISFVQIVSSMPSVMGGVPFPSSFISLSIPLRSFNLDFLAFFSLSSCTLSLDFLQQTVVHLCVPLLFAVTVVGGFMTANVVRKPKNTETKKHRRAQTAKILILGILLLYPGLATRLFTLMNCMSVAGVTNTEYLVNDLAIVCWEGEHASMIIVGVACIVIYIAGIPAAVFLTLWRNRSALWDEAHRDHEEVLFEYGGLYTQYEPAYWWFEVFIIIHKMLMTGALVVIAKGSSVQPLVAVLFQLTFLLVVLRLSPYGEDDDDLSAFVSSLSILLMTLAAVMLISQANANEDELSEADLRFASFFMISITVSVMVYETVMMFFSTEVGGRCRIRISQACARTEGNKKTGGPRVVPSNKTAASSYDQKRCAAELQEARIKFGAESVEYKSKLKEVQQFVL